MRPEVELGVALGVAGGAAEVVDRDSVNADLGEADREFFVEAEEAAHVGQNDHPGSGGRLSPRVEGGELGSVGGGQGQVFNVDRGSGDRGDGGQRFVSVAHIGCTLWLSGSALRG